MPRTPGAILAEKDRHIVAAYAFFVFDEAAVVLEHLASAISGGCARGVDRRVCDAGIVQSILAPCVTSIICPRNMDWRIVFRG